MADRSGTSAAGPGSPDALERTLAFATELLRLEAVERRTRPPGLERHESSAEHSWHACYVAVLLAGEAREPVDVGRVIEILLAHDVPEIDVGDQIAYAARTGDRENAERAAAARLFGMLPAAEAARWSARWEEFEERATPEARFAHAIDRLTPVLLNLASDGQSWRENGIPVERVKELNRVIADALPGVWERVEAAIDRLHATAPLAANATRPD